MEYRITANKICSFFGHRDIEITEELREKLRSLIEKKIIEENFGIFYFGGFGAFDDFCHEIVTELKVTYPHIRRIYALSDERHTRPYKRPRYLTREDYEEFVYLPLDFDYWYSRIYYRNCEIIKLSDFCIFYVNNSKNSGAYKAYSYAKKKKKALVNIAHELSSSLAT